MQTTTTEKPAAPALCSCIHHNWLTCLAEQEHMSRFNALLTFSTSTKMLNARCQCLCHRGKDGQQVSEQEWARRRARKPQCASQPGPARQEERTEAQRGQRAMTHTHTHDANTHREGTVNEKEKLLQEWRTFEDKFKSGHGGWTPSLEEWLQQEQTGRRLLLAALAELSGADPKRIAHCEHYLEPFFWRASDFLDRVIPIVAYRKED